MVKKVRGVIAFDIPSIGKWTLNLKTGTGTVQKNDTDSAPQLTITVKESDFLSLASGKVNPQQAFMKGKIKMKGNMGLAMKLNTVLEATRKQLASADQAPVTPTTATPVTASASSGAPSSATPASVTAPALKSAAVFELIEAVLKDRGEELVTKTKGSYQFNITPGGFWHLDLKAGSGSLVIGTKAADLTITVKDDDFVKMASGKMNAQLAFMKGKIKVKGKMGLAMKLNMIFQATRLKSHL